MKRANILLLEAIINALDYLLVRILPLAVLIISWGLARVLKTVPVHTIISSGIMPVKSTLRATIIIYSGIRQVLTIPRAATTISLAKLPDIPTPAEVQM